jgi:hypothetical protein
MGKELQQVETGLKEGTGAAFATESRAPDARNP